jgi:hypothetical protein
MKFFRFGVVCLLLATFSLEAAPAPSTDGALDSYVCDATWPGVKFKIVAVKRLDSQNILIALHVIAGADAPVSTMIGFWSDNGSPGPITEKHHPLPYSLLKANVVDLATKQSYGAVAQPLASHGYGVSEITTGMHSGEWFQMSVKFPLPVPTPNPDGTIPIQKVDVTLPQAKGPIKNVIVPAAAP